MKKPKRYWHRLSKSASQAYIHKHRDMLAATFMRIFSQPTWCTYPGALSAVMGCWSLIDGGVHCRKDCVGCEELKP